ncbi:lymphocyte-specific protein 1-like isoform X2 [Brienomyrus brachyistius]|uniref:lymphocyte-specific protein 1-like isoform X2 n=1 Tax=Brienomyrus brachyistius TaxID=42636 RepID=UPI0020B1DD7F|nr:lymphocyte-specific protein 1-like isoform X2 [Brienomyrus brachyistius]
MLRGERREISKQGLQNLLRLTAQRSIEDAEEIERERRRQARKLSTTQQELDCGESFPERNAPHDDILHENVFKPSCPSSQDEDEGFGDWTQKMEKSRRRDLEEHVMAKEGGTDSRQGGSLIEQKSGTETPTVEQVEQQVSKGSMSRRRYGPEILKREERMNNRKEKVQDGHRNEDIEPGMTGEKDPRAEQREKVKGNQTDMKMSYISKIYLQQEGGQTDKGTHDQEVTSQAAKVKRTLRGISLNQEGRTRMDTFQETGYKLEQIQHSLQEREREREEQQPIETKLEGLRMREEEEEHQWLIQMGITERTASLNRCLKKSSSFKKIQNPGFISKIDDKVEQYTHAIESSLKEARAAKQAPTDMTAPPEPVATKKNLFEAGDAWNQSFTKGSPSKDAEVLKVGVTDLITQWVKGNLDDGSRISSPKPAEVKYGEVLHKKNLWETLGDTSCFGKPGLGGKGPCSTKRYKFVVTGHGKYEKVPVSDDHCNACTNEQSSGTCPEHS